MSSNGFIMNFHKDYDPCNYLVLSHHLCSLALQMIPFFFVFVCSQLYSVILGIAVGSRLVISRNYLPRAYLVSISKCSPRHLCLFSLVRKARTTRCKDNQTHPFSLPGHAHGERSK